MTVSPLDVMKTAPPIVSVSPSMAKVLPLYPGLERLVIGPRPHTAPVTTTLSFSIGRKEEGSRTSWIHTERLHPGQQLTLAQMEPLIHGRLATIKSALMARDPGGTGLVSREEFRRVLKSLLSVSQNQLDTVLNQVCERDGGVMDYMQFLRRFGRAPTAHRACSRSASERSCPQNTSMSLSEMQRRLKDKIGGNLRTMIRVFSLFDCNREGHIQRHEFRRILDSYCIQLTEKEFQRVWNHYSPSNTSTISYQLFLDKLGFGDSHYFKIVCTKLEVSSRGTTPVKQKKQRPEYLSGGSDTPSVLPQRKRQTLFYDKMCLNSTPVWQALQAFDTTRSGLVKQDVLRAILSSFIFPMNPRSFQKLTSCYGVKATEPVRWKNFLGHFVREGETNHHTDRSLEHAEEEEEEEEGGEGEGEGEGEGGEGEGEGGEGEGEGEGEEEEEEEEDKLDLQDLYPRLKDILHLLEEKKAGCITRGDLQYSLERPHGTRPRLRRSRITELLNALDPEQTGVIQLAGIERLNLSIGSAPTGNTTPPPVDAAEPLDVPEEAVDTAEEQKTSDERQNTQCADKLSLASASRRRMEDLPLDKLSEQLSSVLAALELVDPQHTGYVTEETLKKVLSCCGPPVSESHFNKLCESSSSRPDSSSKSIHYADFLRNLGVLLTDETQTSSIQEQSDHTERLCKTPQSTSESIRGPRPPSVLQVSSDTGNILDIVFQRIRSRLEQSHSSLTDRIRAISHGSDGTLSVTDVRMILEDSLVILDDKNFHEFTEQLGFRDGRIERSAFLVKYEEATARGSRQQSCGEEDEVAPMLAEQWLARMKTRIKTIHGDNLTAFRLMDSNRKGVVYCQDFKELYSTLGYFLSEAEYQRLLGLIGLHPGCNLNYAEFADVVNGKQGPQTTSIQEQLHELLASDAGYKWADMSKVLCQFDADGQSCIHKKSLRGLLFSYALPMRADEFDQLWSRYDPDGRGHVTACDFLEKLGIFHEGKLGPRSQKLNRAVVQQNADRPVNSNSASLEWIEAEKTCEPPPASPDAVRQIESLDYLGPDEALARLRELVAASASNLYKAFVAFDQSGTGTVKALDFRQVLENFCARLSDNQYTYMLTKLQLDRENVTVNWKDFLNKFPSQSPLTRERCPSKTRSPIPTKTSEVTEHLQQIQETVSGHLYEITRDLMDLDPSHSTTISKEKFRQLCGRHCLKLTNDQFECVWSQMPVNKQRKLRYREFLKHFGAPGRRVAGPHTDSGPSASSESKATVSATKRSCPETAGGTLQRAQSAPEGTSRRAASAGRPGTGSLQGGVQRRLRAAVQRCWKEIQKNCTEEDAQQDGHISTVSFLEILQSLSIRMTREQLEHLAVKPDIINKGRVSYHNFLGHFLLNLKPVGTEMLHGSHKLPLHIVLTGPGFLSENCVAAMLRIREAVHFSWTSVRRRFLTYDPARTGSVPAQDFRKVLRHLSVKLSEDEFFHLSSYLDANATGRICYNNFLWAVLH